MLISSLPTATTWKKSNAFDEDSGEYLTMPNLASDDRNDNVDDEDGEDLKQVMKASLCLYATSFTGKSLVMIVSAMSITLMITMFKVWFAFCVCLVSLLVSNWTFEPRVSNLAFYAQINSISGRCEPHDSPQQNRCAVSSSSEMFELDL